MKEALWGRTGSELAGRLAVRLLVTAPSYRGGSQQSVAKASKFLGRSCSKEAQGGRGWSFQDSVDHLVGRWGQEIPEKQVCDSSLQEAQF